MTEPPYIEVDLSGRLFRMIGAGGPVPDAIVAALASNGARPTDGRADLLIISLPLLPEAAQAGSGAAMQMAAEEGRVMAANNGGRIVFLLSALAGLPMRRHVEYSAAMAAALVSMRGLAMHLAPKVLVNAIGAGVIEGKGGAPLAGDPNMLGHAALGRPGAVSDLSNAVLFLCDPLNSYTTGQMLTVDGGWSVGYGRNF